jgi:hypothetical protein
LRSRGTLRRQHDRSDDIGRYATLTLFPECK